MRTEGQYSIRAAKLFRISLRHCRMRLVLVAIAVAMSSVNLSGAAAAQEQKLFGGPVAVALSDDRETAYIANQRLSAITVIDWASMDVRLIQGDWSGLSDLVSVPGTGNLLAAALVPPAIISVPAGERATTEGTAAISLPGKPARIAVSSDCRSACVSMIWDHSVCIVPILESGIPQADGVRIIPLTFPPGELLALSDCRFLVADAFGGHLAVVDPQTASVVAVDDLSGHHIGGMTRDAAQNRILITHQRLSHVAETNRDDIHWGTLIQNNVTSIPESALLDAAGPLMNSARSFELGDVGNGAGDPSGIVTCDDGRYAVAVAGTDQVAVWSGQAEAPVFIDVGRMPTRLSAFGPSSALLCLNTLDDTVSLIDNGNELLVVKVFGTPRLLENPEDRGAAAFFSAGLSHDGWMSCSSCHVDGHSPDLLTDTMGDRRFGNPKRIPSLLNSSVTGPWAWDGSQPSLPDQIRKTLATTMHRDERSREEGPSDDSIANDLAAFLQTLKTPPSPRGQSAAMDRGRAIFSERGCIKCHDPEQHYTSPFTHDVGVTDEFRTRLFNPPSLNGLRHRRAFFHDARFRTLDTLLQSHPNAETILSADDSADLQAFLIAL